jgi:hypothetical protein
MWQERVYVTFSSSSVSGSLGLDGRSKGMCRAVKIPRMREKLRQHRKKVELTVADSFG